MRENEMTSKNLLVCVVWECRYGFAPEETEACESVVILDDYPRCKDEVARALRQQDRAIAIWGCRVEYLHTFYVLGYWDGKRIDEV